MSDGELKEAAAPDRAEGEESPFAPLINQLYRKDVIEARAMQPEDKLILGERLFHWACAATLQGIRMQHPGASDAECQRLERLS